MGLKVQGLESMDRATTMRIRTMIKNRQGLSGGLYVPNDAFHTLVKEQVGLTEGPCLECARDVLNEMQAVQRSATSAVAMLETFPKAREALVATCNDILQTQHGECVKYLKTHVRMNQLRISYGHPDFHKEQILFDVEQQRYGNEDSEEDRELLAKARSGMDLTPHEKKQVRAITERRQRARLEENQRELLGGKPPPKTPGEDGGGEHGSGLSQSSSSGSGSQSRMPSMAGALSFLPAAAASPFGRSSTAQKIRVAEQATAKEELEIEKLLALTRAYFFLVQKQVVDLVPKYIQLLLVEEPKELIVKAIGAMTDSQVAHLMAPSPELQAKRSAVVQALAKLRKAEQMLFDVAKIDTLGLKL